MKLLVIFSLTFVSLSQALSKNEIEAIRKELNTELTQLENVDNKRSDNNQVASVNKNDPADILTQMGTGLTKNEGKDLDSLWQKMVDQRKSSDSKIKRMLKNALIENKKEKENKDLARLFADDNTKKSSSLSTDDDLEALLNILKNDDEKSKKRSAEENSKKRQKSEEVCKDNRDDCPNYKHLCEDLAYGNLIKKKCPVTCGVCEPCMADKWSKSYCERAEKSSLCDVDKYKDRLKTNCYETCGYCRVPSPPACSMDPQGCCWDGATFVKDGCNQCADTQSYGKLCGTLISECTNKYDPGKWMKKHCPVTCKFCDPKNECHDFKQYKKQCKMWREEGKCSDDTAVQTICPRTCNVCPKNAK